MKVSEQATILCAAGIHNAHNLVSQFGGATIYYHTPSDSRDFTVSGWTVSSCGTKRINRQKTLSWYECRDAVEFGLFGRDREKARLDAIAFATLEFGCDDWTPAPFKHGGRSYVSKAALGKALAYALEHQQKAADRNPKAGT